MPQVKAVLVQNGREHPIGHIVLNRQGLITRAVTLPDAPLGPFFDLEGRDLLIAYIRIELVTVPDKAVAA